ncbi:hypothetical protein [Sanyastnella coralliicola]|uniref:hypothetical protein n=1 Tax=Sanyastnella coralliicola TaxID=3069118 RepID=UPI0027B9657E|nr:hypothetical protein [Longitalea sp. SCSIO 12813]
MERIEGTQVLLLNDHLQDGDKVFRVLDWLEALGAIHVEHRTNQALGFFSEEEEAPAAIIMFMNCQDVLGVYLGENYRLMSLQDHGTRRLKYMMHCQIVEANLNRSCLADFFHQLVPKDRPLTYFSN